LRFAAILGRRFDFETLQTASNPSTGSGWSEDELIETLELAERAQLVSEMGKAGGGTFSFAHALIPAALVEGVSGLRRRRWHKRALDAIEQLHPDDYERLAYHCVQAAEDERALDFYRQAADRARKVYANDDAIRCYTEALHLLPAAPERFEVLASRTAVYDIIAEREKHYADIDAMLRLAEKLNDDARRCDALLALADYHLNTDIGGAQEPAARAADLARKLGDPAREGRALLRLGRLAVAVGNDSQSRQMLEESVARFREMNLPGETATSLNELSLALRNLGDYSAARAVLEEAVALSRQVGDKRKEGTALRRMAYLESFQGRYAEALQLAEAAQSLHRAIGDRAEECWSFNALGLFAFERRQLELAEGYFRQWLELAEAIGNVESVNMAVGYLITAHLQRGAHEAALALVSAQWERANRTNNEVLIGILRFHQTWPLFLFGQFEKALALAQALLAPAERLGWAAVVLTKIGQCQAGLGEHALARENLEAALERAKESGNPPDVLTWSAYTAWLEGQSLPPGAREARLRMGLDHARQAMSLLPDTRAPGLSALLAEAHLHAARLHLALGETEAALGHSIEALRLGENNPHEATIEQFHFTHSRILRAIGREAEANEHLQKAYERVMLVARNTQDETLRRSWLENVRDNREIVAAWEQGSQ
jgi:tetratricopeptide (TPR) repeat protein